MLKVFVSTESTQGHEPGDFCYVPAAELVGRYSLVCDREQSDGTGCGCGRAFGGFETHRRTTTAMVVERDITELQWRAAMFETLRNTGWADAMPAGDLARFIDDLVDHVSVRPAKCRLGRSSVAGRGTKATQPSTG